MLWPSGHPYRGFFVAGKTRPWNLGVSGLVFWAFPPTPKPLGCFHRRCFLVRGPEPLSDRRRNFVAGVVTPSLPDPIVVVDFYQRVFTVVPGVMFS